MKTLMLVLLLIVASGCGMANHICKAFDTWGMMLKTAVDPYYTLTDVEKVHIESALSRMSNDLEFSYAREPGKETDFFVVDKLEDANGYSVNFLTVEWSDGEFVFRRMRHVVAKDINAIVWEIANETGEPEEAIRQKYCFLSEKQ